MKIQPTQLDRIEKQQELIIDMLAALCAKADYEVDALSELAQILREQPKPIEGLTPQYDIEA